MNTALLVFDAVAIAALVFGIYAPRHHRRDLVTAFIGLNIGVLVVSTILVGISVGIGVGLGLFGVLSIVRLRSDELAQHEIAYYFSALALGLLGGVSIGQDLLSGALMAVIVGAMFIADHPRVMAHNRRQLMVLDRAILGETELRIHLEHELDANILGVAVQRIDQVNDLTMVDVRFRPHRKQADHTADQRIAAGRA